MPVTAQTSWFVRVSACSQIISLAAFLFVACMGPAACSNTHEPKVAQAAKQPAKQFTATEGNLKYLKVAVVQRSSGASTIALNGRVTFDEDRTAQVGTPVEGRVIRVLTKPGDTVRRGQSLLVIRSPVYTLAESAEQKARSALQVAEKNLARVQRLFAEGAASQREVTEAEDTLVQAHAEYERAAADLAALGGHQDDPSPEFQLTAPINGVVISRSPAALVGAEVQPGSGVLFIIADLSQVWVLADLPERELGGVHPGLSVEVEAQAYPGVKFPGTVEYISELLDQSTRTAKLRCVVPNGQLRLKPEMFVDVTLHRPSANLLIPTSAVVTQGEKFFVYVEDDEKQRVYTPREVILGPEVGSQVPVVKGLQGGERIVIDGAILLDAALHKLL
jgi:cobalt-zinc-cadmium efflux system membrane fusion protein